METWVLITIIIVIFFVIKTFTGKLDEFRHHFVMLNDELQKIRAELELLRKGQEPPAVKAPEKPIIQEPVPVIVPQPVIPIPEPVIPIPQPVQVPLPPEIIPPKTVPLEAEKVPTVISEPPKYIAPMAPEPVYHQPEPSFYERFMHDNPDMEKFIGENLINKIGIAILVLGIGYFVKFAIDKDWINEIGRVFIGILAGGLLIGVAHRLRLTFAAFSSVLVGGGLAVLYFTIAIAFHEYHLFSQAAAFVIMAVITGFSVLLSISYNRVELAVLAILGGFATPFMVSTGEGNYQVLFTYVLILNIGMLVLAYLKGWKIINWICYGFTILLFSGWLATKVLNTPDGPFLGALLFASLFYMVFFLMNIIKNIKERTPFEASEIWILLSNTFLYYTAGMAVLYHIQNGMYQGLFTVGVAVFNFAFAFVLFRSRQVDRNLVYLLIGLVITFISLAIPVQLEGNYITMFWALEAVLLLWFAQKTGIKLAFVSSLIIAGLMLISLIMDWQQIYIQYAGKTPHPILLNKGFITGVISILSLGAIFKLLQRNSEPVDFSGVTFEPLIFRRIIGVFLFVLGYLVLLLELNYQLNLVFNYNFNKTIILGTYNLAFILSLFVFAQYKNRAGLSFWITLLGLLGLVLYCLLYNPEVYRLLDHHFLQNVQETTGYIFHYFNLVLVGSLIYYVYRNRNYLAQFGSKTGTVLLWVLSFVSVYIVSSELLYHMLYFNLPFSDTTGLSADNFRSEQHGYFDRLRQQTFKVGFPILWGLCAFIFMFIGLKQKHKHLRIIALTLFSITLLKLFLFDIRGISEGGKIAAFICLGVLLLVISFMYQNIKKLILADENLPEKEAGQ